MQSRCGHTRTETEKIEALLKHVDGLADARFVRNGTEYDARSAAKFLPGQGDTNRKEIKTAKDFVEKGASISGTTGKPYLIRFKEDQKIRSGEDLTAELKKLD